MALLTALPFEAAAELVAGYGLELERVDALPDGSVNSNFCLRTRDGRRWFGRLFEEQGPEGAAGEARLAHELHSAGVPVVVPAQGPPSAHAGKPFALYPWVEGEIACQARVTPGRCRALGSALAALHLARPSHVPEGRFRASDLRARLDRVEASAPDDLRRAARELRTPFERWFGARDPGLPAGLVHGDLFRDNVLWRHGHDEIAALLDFESACKGSYAYDLAVTALAWCYGSELEAPLVHALYEGYTAVRPLTLAERAGFRAEAAAAALRFAITRITDYAWRAPPGVPPKRAYQRFVARLAAVESGALEPA